MENALLNAQRLREEAHHHSNDSQRNQLDTWLSKQRVAHFRSLDAYRFPSIVGRASQRQYGVERMAVSGDGRVFVTLAKSYWMMHDVETNSLILTTSRPANAPLPKQLLTNGKQVAFLYDDGMKLLSNPERLLGEAQCGVFLAEGQLVLATRPARNPTKTDLQVWDVVREKKVESFELKIKNKPFALDQVLSISDNTLLLMGQIADNPRGYLHRWTWKQGEISTSFGNAQTFANSASVASLAGGEKFAIQTQDGKLYLIDANPSAKPTCLLEKDCVGVMKLRDDRFFVVAETHQLSVWQADGQRQIQLEFATPITACCTLKSNRIAIGLGSGRIQVLKVMLP
jgi:hypothetical protein